MTNTEFRVKLTELLHEYAKSGVRVTSINVSWLTGYDDKGRYDTVHFLEFNAKMETSPNS